jgi:hypothetical protein
VYLRASSRKLDMLEVLRDLVGRVRRSHGGCKYQGQEEEREETRA